jgi:hypothetical protein
VAVIFRIVQSFALRICLIGGELSSSDLFCVASTTVEQLAMLPRAIQF